MHVDHVSSRGALTLRELAARFFSHAQVYYRRRDGSLTREHLNVRSSLEHLLAVAGSAGEAPAGDVDRHTLRRLREALVSRGLSRSYVNASMARIHRCFKWAVAEDLIEPRVLSEFLAVPPLKAHRSAAREPEPVQPVAPSRIAAVLPHLRPRNRAVIQLLELTGARVGEILALRNGDINDENPNLWWAIPPFHKTQHYGHRRAVPLDRRCIAIVSPWLRPFLPEDPIFDIKPNSLYTALQRACKRAGVEPWSAHQVRHRVATTVRQRVGLDAAQVLLGHASARTTERYAHVFPDQAARAQEAL